MGELIEKTVTMGPEDWRASAAAARRMAVKWAYKHDESDRLAKAAEMLRAAKTFEGHANMLDMGGEVDIAEVEHWDLTDEGISGEPLPA